MNMSNFNESSFSLNSECQMSQDGIVYDQNNNTTAQLTPNNQTKRIQEYADEYFEMPECAEKFILELICRCEGPFGSMNDVNTILANLENRLREEALDSKPVREIFSRIKRSTTLNLDMLEQMLGCIRDIDIHRLKRLTSGNNEALEVIRGKNVYLFMGLTGHGKSTTIHHLAGSKFKEHQVNGEVMRFATGRPHYIPISDIKELEKVTTSPYPESDTHNIIPVEVTLPDGRQVIMCDSPGFEDTNGVELDIANSIAIENAISECAGVKPIVVISKNMGERMTGI